MSKFTKTGMNTRVEFNHENAMVVFMALECIDEEFSYEMYSSYMMQFKNIPTIPESRYLDLLKIVANKD